MQTKRQEQVAHSLRRVREKKRAIIAEAKSKPCADCGGTFDPFVMDLDHRPDEAKLCNVAAAITLGLGEARLREEIAKCDVVCANCHRMRTLSRKPPVKKARTLSKPAPVDRTHCPKGHPYDAINTRVRQRCGVKSRVCITCVREADRARSRYRLR